MVQNASEPRAVCYFDGVTPVKIGDHVEVRGIVLFFLRKIGRVVYIPGISKPHSEMEFNGLTWVGVDYEAGFFNKTLVDPDTNCLQKCVSFLKRGETHVRQLNPDETFDD